MLRGQRVLARCDEAGTLTAEGGRVEVRYKPNGSAYQAGERNLESISGGEILPDDHCGPSAEPAKKKATKDKAAAAEADRKSVV